LSVDQAYQLAVMMRVTVQHQPDLLSTPHQHGVVRGQSFAVDATQSVILVCHQVSLVWAVTRVAL